MKISCSYPIKSRSIIPFNPIKSSMDLTMMNPRSLLRMAGSPCLGLWACYGWCAPSVAWSKWLNGAETGGEGQIYQGFCGTFWWFLPGGLTFSHHGSFLMWLLLKSVGKKWESMWDIIWCNEKYFNIMDISWGIIEYSSIGLWDRSSQRLPHLKIGL